VVLVLRGAWCWWCVVLVVRFTVAAIALIDRVAASFLSCSHIYAQFVICRVYMTYSFAMQEP
jgi:hypothetical protein